jgi:hypothetical protein
MTSPNRHSLSQLDAELARLRTAHPDWNIWYVPQAQGPVIWCAQPRPLLNCCSPAELNEYIEEAEGNRLWRGGSDLDHSRSVCQVQDPTCEKR